MSVFIMLLVPVLVLVLVAVGACAGCGFDAVATGEKPLSVPIRVPETPPAPPSTTVNLPPPGYYYAVLATPGLRHYWRLGDAPASGIAADSAPVPNAMLRPGSYRDGVTRGVPGALRPKEPADTAAAFDGAKGYVEVPYDAMVNPLPMAFSVQAWIRPDTVAPPGTTIIRTIVGSYEVTPPRGFVLELVLSSSAAGNSTANVRVRLGDGTKFTSLELDLGAGTGHDSWRHVVTTYDSTVTPSQLTLYVQDGVDDRVAERSDVGYQPVTATSLAPLRIGAGRAAVGAATAADFYKGRIDEVALYALVLRPTTIDDDRDAAVAT